MSFNNGGPGFVHSGGGVSGDGTGITDPADFRNALLLDDHIDVRDYGAVLDWNGSAGTDDTAAIQAAIDATESRVSRAVRIPGRAKITEALVMKANGLILFGDNNRNCELYQANPDAHGVEIWGNADDGDAESRLHTGIQHLRITGVGSATSTKSGIHCAKSSGAEYEGGKLYIDYVRVRGFQDGFYLRFWDGWQLTRSAIQYCQTAVNVGRFTNSAKIKALNVGHNTLRSLYFATGARVTLDQLDCGNLEKQWGYVDTGAAVVIRDSNFESITGVAGETVGGLVINGGFDVANGASLSMDNVSALSLGTAMPGIYQANVSYVNIAGAGFGYIGNGASTAVAIHRAGAGSVTRWLGQIPSGSNRTSGYPKVSTGVLGAAGFVAIPTPFDTSIGINNITSCAENRGLPWIRYAQDNLNTGDHAYLMMKREDGTIQSEPILNSDANKTIAVAGTTYSLLPNSNYETKNAALTTLTLPARASSVATITIADPGVVTWASHGLALNDRVSFSTTGALPTGLTAATVYFVRTIPTANTFTMSLTADGPSIATTGSQSGTHTAVKAVNVVVGDIIRVIGNGTGGWKIVAGGNSQIHFGDQVTAVSTGFIQSLDGKGCVTLKCFSASGDGYFKVVESTGIITTETASSDRIVTKTTTGDPATGIEGKMAINTFDNTVKIYADGGWRTIASGW